MLGDILYEEKGKTTGMRVLSSEGREVTVEVTVQTEGHIRGVGERTVWTYRTKTRADGTIYGEGKGFMTTKDGDVINLTGSGGAKSRESDGSVKYRGALYMQTASKRFASLNGAVGVKEDDVDAEGNTVSKAWEWK